MRVVAYLMIYFLSIAILLLSSSQQVNGNKVVSFKRFGTLYQYNNKELPTYIYEDDGLNSIFFRGYFEIYFAEDSQATGRYSIVENQRGALDPVPPIAEKEKLTPQRSFQIDMTVLYLPKDVKENVTIRIYPDFKVNINPYSVRGFLHGTLPGQAKQFIPLFPKSNEERPTLGPWEFTFPLDVYVRNFYVFEMFAYSTVDVEYNTLNRILYPRWLQFKDGNLEDALVIMYDHADTLDPNALDAPTIQVNRYNKEVVLTNDFVPLQQFLFTQHSITGKLSYAMAHPIKKKKAIIDPYSVKCAYATGVSNFQQVLYDEMTLVEVVDSEFVKVTCTPNIPSDQFVLVVVGKPIVYNYCYENNICKIVPSLVTNVDIAAHLYLKFNANTQLTGSFKGIIIYGDEKDKLAKIPTSYTNQSPLTLVRPFRIDYSETKLNYSIPKVDSKQNLVNLKISHYDKNTNTDPYSFRLFKLNEERQIFELISEDIPSLIDIVIDMDWEQNINKSIVYAVFDYQETAANIGELTYVYYSREANYKLSDKDTLGVYFKEVYTQSINYNKRPYFTITPYTPNIIEDLGDYLVLYSFIQQNGNNLESYGFDEGRKFTISQSSLYKTKNGGETFVDLDGLKCAYLFKETKFSEYEFSTNIAYPNQDGSYTIDCHEDIRDESFVFILVAKPLKFKTEAHSFNTSYILNPTTVSVFNALTFPDDTLTVQFQPFTKNTGDYTINDITAKLRTYKYEPTKLPLQVIGGYDLDLQNIRDNDQDDKASILTLTYKVNTSLINVDPFSYKFMMAVDEFQDMKYLFSSDEPTDKPWVCPLDMLKHNRLEFAVLAYMENVGRFGESYSLHYERTLRYELLEKSQYLFFHFSSALFPSFENRVEFVLSKSDRVKINDNSYNVVKAFPVKQNIKADILTKRQFHFKNDLTDISGNIVKDVKSLECIYISTDRIIYGNSKLTTTEEGFTLECSETITLESYDWVIVSKSVEPNPKPLPSTQPPVRGNDVASTVLGVMVGFLLIVIIVLVISMIAYVIIKRTRTNRDEELVPLDAKNYRSSLNYTL